MRAALILALTAACGETAKFNATCASAMTQICTHQVDCALSFDHAGCDEDLQNNWICDPSVSVEALETCRDAAPETSCNEVMPEVCYEVLCDQDLGCIETSDGPDDSSPESSGP